MRAGRLAVLLAVIGLALAGLAVWTDTRAEDATAARAQLRQQRDAAVLGLRLAETDPERYPSLLRSVGERAGASACLRRGGTTLGSSRSACGEAASDPAASVLSTRAGSLIYLRDTARRDAELAQVRVEVYAVHVGLALLLAVVVFRLGGRRDDEVLAAVSAGLEALSEGDLGARVTVRAEGLEATLVDRANAVADRLQVTVERQRTFLADTAHQLRNPLSALHLRAENLEVHVSPQGRGSHARLLQDVARLEQTLDDLVVFARADEQEAQTQVVDVLAVVRDRSLAWLPKAFGRDVLIRQVLPDQAVALSRAGALEQALDVVLDNALTHAPRRTEVTVLVVPTATHVEVRVQDRGRGLPKGAHEQAALRGWQRDPRAGGSGLGLAIAGLLLSSSGGRLQLLDRTDGPGLVAVLRLPTPAVEVRDDHSPAWARERGQD